MDRFKLRETILREIEKPLIPEQRYSVLEFGAEPDSSRIQTEAFQLAIDGSVRREAEKSAFLQENI